MCEREALALLAAHRDRDPSTTYPAATNRGDKPVNREPCAECGAPMYDDEEVCQECGAPHPGFCAEGYGPEDFEDEDQRLDDPRHGQAAGLNRERNRG